MLSITLITGLIVFIYTYVTGLDMRDIINVYRMYKQFILMFTHVNPHVNIMSTRFLKLKF